MVLWQFEENIYMTFLLLLSFWKPINCMPVDFIIYALTGQQCKHKTKSYDT